ncbi:MAG: lipoate--protein ligase [Thermoguttaceae bacterium]
MEKTHNSRERIRYFYCINESTSPDYNLGLEEAFLRSSEPILLLWRNESSVIVGRHQNTFEEVDLDFAHEHSIHVVRRISGGGAVYHDLGTLNYSILVSDQPRNLDFETFTKPIIYVLRKLGVRAEASGRNDIVVCGKKISGAAQFRWKNRLLHHGSILFETDLDRLEHVLHVSPHKYSSRAIASVRSRVGNLVDFLPTPITIAAFQQMLLDEIKPQTIELDAEINRTAHEFCHEKYQKWEWNVGSSPPFWTHTGLRKFSWGLFDIRLEVESGQIKSCQFFGDFFANDDPIRLAERLKGIRFDRATFDQVISESEIHAIFPYLSKTELSEIIFSGSSCFDEKIE